MMLLRSIVDVSELTNFSHARIELKRIFDPLVTDIIRLINDQVQRIRLKQMEDGIKVRSGI